jgi:hypothetical protein
MSKLLTTITEVLMILYWIFAGALVLGLISIDPSLMYSDYENPLVVAWNWSFFPIDIAFAGIGLFARFADISDVRKGMLETISATLMICAGLMAISYWVVTLDFNIVWWGLNIWLLGLGLWNLAHIQQKA